MTKTYVLLGYDDAFTGNLTQFCAGRTRPERAQPVEERMSALHSVLAEKACSAWDTRPCAAGRIHRTLYNSRLGLDFNPAPVAQRIRCFGRTEELP